MSQANWRRPNLRKPAILNFCVHDSRWRRIHGLRWHLEKAAKLVLAELPKSLPKRGSVTVLLTTNKELRRLNRDFRGIDKVTNVLSFPQFTPRELTKIGKGKTALELGDIALGYQYIVDEAKNNHKILINHVTHLLVHGLLHLFGYDHGSNKEARRMEQLEKIVMVHQLGLPDPYEQHVDRRHRLNPMAKK